MVRLTSLFAILLMASVAYAQDIGAAKKVIDQKHLPTVSGTPPTNGQVLTWDSTLNKAKWAAGGGGGGSFDPAAATNITFAKSYYRIRGSQSDGLTLEAASNGEDGRPVYLQGQTSDTGSSGATLSINGGYNGNGADIVGYCSNASSGSDGDGGKVVFHIGAKDGEGHPGLFAVETVGGDRLFTIGYDGTITGPTDVHTHLKSSLGTRLYLETSHTTATDEASGDVNIRSGATDDGDTGYIILQVPTPGGSDRSANNIQLYLGAATGSGTPSSFQIYDGSASLLLEVNQDGTLYGPTGKAFEIQTASSQSLHFTSSNQMLFNDAGHYIRMGIGWMNLPSDGGIYWCSETTASTPEAMLFRSGTREYRLASDINADDTDRPIKFSIKSCDGPNLNCGLDLYSNGGTGTISQNYGGAFGGASTLNLIAGGNTVTISVAGLTTAIGRIVVGTSGPRIEAGDDSPESAVTAPVGSVYLRKNGGSGTTFYVKESGTGNTGWVAK